MPENTINSRHRRTMNSEVGGIRIRNSCTVLCDTLIFAFVWLYSWRDLQRPCTNTFIWCAQITSNYSHYLLDLLISCSSRTLGHTQFVRVLLQMLTHTHLVQISIYKNKIGDIDLYRWKGANKPDMIDFTLTFAVNNATKCITWNNSWYTSPVSVLPQFSLQ